MYANVRLCLSIRLSTNPTGEGGVHTVIVCRNTVNVKVFSARSVNRFDTSLPCAPRRRLIERSSGGIGWQKAHHL